MAYGTVLSRPVHIVLGKADMITQGAQGYLITEVCLHTSATAAKWPVGKTVAQMRDEIKDWHVNPKPPKKGWKDIGYHYVVAPDGSVALGRKLSVIGAGVEGHNRGVIHICMVPKHEVTAITKFEDWYTPLQFKAVRKIIADLKMQTALKEVTGHNDYAYKLCPGFKVSGKGWL